MKSIQERFGRPDCDLGATSLIKMYEDSIVKHWSLPALTDIGGKTLTYGNLAERIARLHILFRRARIQPGDKAAIYGQNSSDGVVVYMSLITYGAVPVTIIRGFNPWNVQAIVNHSGAKLLFTDADSWVDLNPHKMPGLIGVLQMDDLTCRFCRSAELAIVSANIDVHFNSAYPDGFHAQNVSYEEEQDMDGLALLNYTSGTTSDPKGVMIPYRALLMNVKFACKELPLQRTDSVVATFPLAHMFGLAFMMMYELLLGSRVCLMPGNPAPSVMFDAFAQAKPKLVIVSPLMIERYVNRTLSSVLKKPSVSFCMSNRFLRNFAKARIRKNLLAKFGGSMDTLILGGSAMPSELEKLLREIDFPYTVGYGTTECAPLISYSDRMDFVPGTCGKVLSEVKVKILDDDRYSNPGEILVKGPNLMLGYYKDQKTTDEVIDSDGWYHTGDLGKLDDAGNLSVVGRCRDVIVTESGHHIYPEEIEDELVGLPYIQEALVVKRGDALVALALPDYQEGKADGLTPAQVREEIEENMNAVNALLPEYSQVTQIEIRTEPFERTPKKSIRRFLYS